MEHFAEDLFLTIATYLDPSSLYQWSLSCLPHSQQIQTILPFLIRNSLQSLPFSLQLRVVPFLRLQRIGLNDFFLLFILTEISSVSIPTLQMILIEIYLHQTPLKTLNLYGFQIGNQGLFKLSTAIHQRKIEIDCLNLGNNGIDSEGIPYLSSFCKIKTLSLNDNQIDKRGISYLTHWLFQKRMNITSISLSGNPLDDEAATILSRYLEASPSTSLHFLCLCRTNISCIGRTIVMKSWGFRKPIGLFL